MDAEREKRWRVIEAIGARNADKNPEEVERDIAETLREMREEEQAKATATPRP